MDVDPSYSRRTTPLGHVATVIIGVPAVARGRQELHGIDIEFQSASCPEQHGSDYWCIRAEAERSYYDGSLSRLSNSRRLRPALARLLLPAASGSLASAIRPAEQFCVRTQAVTKPRRLNVPAPE